MAATVLTFPVNPGGAPPGGYSADDIARVLSSFVTSGYVQGIGQECLVEPGSGLQVLVRDGNIVADGRVTVVVEGTGNVELAVPPNALGATRYDRVIHQLDYTTNLATFLYRPGTTSGPPAIEVSALRLEQSLAQVAVPTGASSITALMITDERNDDAVMGASYSRGVTPPYSMQELYSRSPATGATSQVLSGQAGGNSVIVPAGKVAIIEGGFAITDVDPSMTINGAEAYTFHSVTYMAFKRPFYVNAGVTIAVENQAWIRYTLIPAEAGKTPVVIQLKYDGFTPTNFVLGSNERLVVTHVHPLVDHVGGANNVMLLTDAAGAVLGPPFWRGQMGGSSLESEFDQNWSIAPATIIKVTAGIASADFVYVFGVLETANGV